MRRSRVLIFNELNSTIMEKKKDLDVFDEVKLLWQFQNSLAFQVLKLW